MKSLKKCCSLEYVIILIITICVKIEGTYVCGHLKNHSPVATGMYHFLPKKIVTTSNPETKIEIVQFAPEQRVRDIIKTFYVLKNDHISKENLDAESKRNALASIVKFLQGNKVETHIPINVKHQLQLPSTGNKSSPRAHPQHSTNMHVNHQVVNGHNYVYNVNNYGTHYHNYDSKGPETDLVSPNIKPINGINKKMELKNDVKLA